MTSPSHPSKVDAEAAVVYGEQSVRLFSFLSDLYLCKSFSVSRPQPLIPTPAYIFWSVFTSLAPTFFYFSVWELAIAGPEASLLCTLSPLLLGIPSVHLFLTSRWGRITSHLLSLVGLAAYRFRDPLHRLWLVNIANIFVCALAAVEWSGTNSFYRGTGQSAPLTCPTAKLIQWMTVLGLSFIFSSVAKLANHSNNPGVFSSISSSSTAYAMVSMAICGREYWRVQQNWYFPRPPGSHGVIPSTNIKSVCSSAKGPSFPVMDNLRAGAWLPHIYFAQPPCGFHYHHRLVMDRIPCPRACATFARIPDDNRPVYRFGHTGAVAFGLGQHPSAPRVVCLRGSQRIRHVSPP